MTVSYTPGAFVWHEYVALQDLAPVQRFYAELFGWTIKAEAKEGMPAYPEIYVGEKGIGGFHQADPAHMPAGTPAHWFGYVSVDDVDASAERARAAGGSVHVGPMDIPRVGRFAVIADPQGAVFATFRSTFGDPPDGQLPANGDVVWDSLATTDIPAATGFYGKVVGWTTKDDGEVFHNGDLMEASYGPTQGGAPAHWMMHIAVANLDESREKAVALGAKVFVPRIDIPYGSFAIVADPLGAVFAIFEGKQQ